MRRVVTIVFVSLAVLIVGAIAFVQVSFSIMQHETNSKLAALPPIARNLPANFQAADIEFKDRVSTQFPIGSSENDMIRTLETGGFKFASFKDAKHAFIEIPGLPCKLTWSITWKVDGYGTLTSVTGKYGGTCL